MKSYVCITAGEWQNLCSMGRIRLQEARAISDIEQLSPECYDLLFSLAPDRFLLGETSDFLITEYSCLHSEIEGIRPPGYEIGIRWLLLQDIIQFFPLRADDAWAFEVDATRAQVTLGAASFEAQWKQWFKDQVVDQACINGLILSRTLGFEPSLNSHEVNTTAWGNLARQIVSPDPDIPDTSDFSANFLTSRDHLFDLVREDVDCGSFFVSCPIEWINIRCDCNIFDSDTTLAEQAQHLHQKYLNVSFEASLAYAEDIKEFEALLISKFPDSFPGPWRPTMISLYVRLSHLHQFGSLAPDDIVESVRAIDTSHDRRAAEMLAFLLGIALGSNKTHSIERSLHHSRFVVAMMPPPVVLSHQMADASTESISSGERSLDHVIEGPASRDPNIPCEIYGGLESSSSELTKTPESPVAPEALQPPTG
jgi:hypothetical protein